MNIPLSPAVLVFLALVLALVSWLWILDRGRVRETARVAEALGFQAVPVPSSELADQLLTPWVPRWREARAGTLELSSVFRKSVRAGDLYLFDMVSRSRNTSVESSRTESSVVGVVRTGAALPFFKVYRVPQDGGRASKVALKWIGLELGERRVLRFEDVPEFDRRFTAIATGEDDEETVRRYLTAEARLGLLDLRFWTLMAGGDGLELLDPTLAQGRNQTGRLETAIEEALRAAEILAPPEARRNERW